MSPILDVLLPRVRAAVLGATYAQPDKWWFFTELARFLRMPPSSLQREIEALSQAGLLLRRRDGRRVYFRANAQSPVYDELRRLLEKTAGVVPLLRAGLEPFAGQIAAAFIYGSMARQREHAASDVDLMVIGTVDLADLLPALKEAERRLGREINVTNYSPQEFGRKLAKKDHFITTVLRRPKRFVKGSERELERMARPRRRAGA